MPLALRTFPSPQEVISTTSSLTQVMPSGPRLYSGPHLGKQLSPSGLFSSLAPHVSVVVVTVSIFLTSHCLVIGSQYLPSPQLIASQMPAAFRTFPSPQDVTVTVSIPVPVPVSMVSTFFSSHAFVMGSQYLPSPQLISSHIPAALRTLPGAHAVTVMVPVSVFVLVPVSICLV